MTETSGEQPAWLAPAGGAFPGNGAWSIALKMQQALTAGKESALLYWQFAGGTQADGESLTGSNDPTTQPKYVAVKHFAKYIRPGAMAVKTQVTGNNDLTASAYVHKDDHTLTIVLVNKNSADQTAAIQLPNDYSSVKSFETVTSSDGKLWQESTTTPTFGGPMNVTVPGYGVVTLFAKNS
jgi:O-glycosyl hydrolase